MPKIAAQTSLNNIKVLLLKANFSAGSHSHGVFEALPFLNADGGNSYALEGRVVDTSPQKFLLSCL